MRLTLLPYFLLLFLLGCSSGSGSDADTDTDTVQPPAVISDQAQYLIDNAGLDGVTVTESGLQYEVISDADGAKPGTDDDVIVHYTGTLIDGTEFDSSYARGVPATFALSGVIPGFAEGLQLMSVGSMYRFVVPAELAYEDRGAGTFIGPDAVLIFVVELLGIDSV